MMLSSLNFLTKKYAFKFDIQAHFQRTHFYKGSLSNHKCRPMLEMVLKTENSDNAQLIETIYYSENAFFDPELAKKKIP